LGRPREVSPSVTGTVGALGLCRVGCARGGGALANGPAASMPSKPS